MSDGGTPRSRLRSTILSAAVVTAFFGSSALYEWHHDLWLREDALTLPQALLSNLRVCAAVDIQAHLWLKKSTVAIFDVGGLSSDPQSIASTVNCLLVNGWRGEKAGAEVSSLAAIGYDHQYDLSWNLTADNEVVWTLRVRN